MTKIEITNQYSTVTLSVNKDDMTINEMFEDLIKPSMYALGYSPELIDGYLPDEME